MATKKPTSKTKSNVSKSTQLTQFTFKWWMAVVLVVAVAVIGIAILKFSHASSSPVPSQTLSIPAVPIIGEGYSLQTAGNPYKNVTVGNVNGRGAFSSCTIYQNYKSISGLNACLVENNSNILFMSSGQFVNFKNNKQLQICAFVQKPADPNSHLSMQLSGFSPVSPIYGFTTKSDTYGCFNSGKPIPAIQFKNISLYLENNKNQNATYPVASIEIYPVQ